MCQGGFALNLGVDPNNTPRQQVLKDEAASGPRAQRPVRTRSPTDSGVPNLPRPQVPTSVPCSQVHPSPLCRLLETQQEGHLCEDLVLSRQSCSVIHQPHFTDNNTEVPRGEETGSHTHTHTRARDQREKDVNLELAQEPHGTEGLELIWPFY